MPIGGGGGGGGSQPFSVVGPFHITHSTPNLGAGVALTTFTIGTIVLRLWAMLTLGWDTGLLHVGLGQTDGSGGADAIIYDLALSGGAPFELNAYFGQLTDPASPPVTFFQDYPLVGIAQTNFTSLVVTVTDGSPSFGEADIYAMLYTP